MTFLDPRSVAGKDLHVEERCQLLVVGGGPAGLAAAIEAAGLGVQVILVDENPVPITTMGEDVPLHFGSGMSGLARNRNAMLEAMIASQPMIEQAFEAGVDVRLGTFAWGLYANGESVGWLPGPLAGIADDERSWLIGCDRVVVAAGRRDMGLAFPGWDKPRVLGATAAERLATRYGALDATSAVLLGSTAEALAAGLALQRAGIRVAAVIEQAGAPVGPADLVAELQAGGAEILARHVIREALGREGVEAVLVGPVGAGEAGERRIDCDAVLLGIGTVPVVELLDPLGCRITFQPERGGYAPVLGPDGATSLSFLWAAGDCAGIWAAKSHDAAIAEAEGRRAGAAAAASLGQVTSKASPPPHAEVLAGGQPRSTQNGGASFEADLRSAPQDEEVEAPLRSTPPDEDVAGSAPPPPAYDIAAYRLDWVRAAVIEAKAEPYVCQCEEVTAREILEVRPPRYLKAVPDRRNDRSLRSLLGEGPPNPDQVKRLTRAGMGPCQGRRCREQVAALLALGAGTALAEVPLAGYRAPVRPLSLRLAADRQEPAEMQAEWDTWFGIPPQARLVADLKPLYTVAAGNPDGPVMSE